MLDVLQLGLLNFVLPLLVGLLASWLYEWIRHKELPKLWRSRAGLLFLLSGILVGILFAYCVQYFAAYEVEMVQPLEGEIVGARFDVRGRAGRTGEEPNIYVVLRELETPGAAWIISDAALLSPNGWWSAAGRVPPSAPLGAQLQVYAFRSSVGTYRTGDRFAEPPRPQKKGGKSNVVTVTYLHE